MLDAKTIDPTMLAKLLLMDEHDTAHQGRPDVQFISGEVDEATDEDAEDGVRAVRVSYSCIASDEYSAFPLAEILEQDDMEPGDGDKYRSDMILAFPDLFAGHTVLLDGSHTSGGNSDESHEGYFTGLIMVTPKDRVDAQVGALRRSHHGNVLQDAASRLGAVIRQIDGIGWEQIAGSDLWKKAAELNRVLAGAG